MRLVSILHDLLLCDTEQKDSKEELTRQVQQTQLYCEHAGEI